MITVIGLGEIGGNVFREIARVSGKESVFGVDISEETLERFKKEGFKVGKNAPPSEVYIIAVYLTEQVIEIMKSLDYSKKPLVSIDSTILPGTSKKILGWKKKEKKEFDFVLFPHRFNPNDSEHYVFNLDRVIGAENEKALKRAIDFFSKYMDTKLIHPFSLEIAELTKPVENAYRFMEIVIAEQLRMSCEDRGINFEDLRRAASTKWNIKILEARDGVGGKCLPKDTQLINNFFPNNKLFKQGFEFNEEYKKWANEKIKKK
jgi:nucleotide sugar dehydrogenase